MPIFIVFELALMAQRTSFSSAFPSSNAFSWSFEQNSVICRCAFAGSVFSSSLSFSISAFMLSIMRFSASCQ